MCAHVRKLVGRKVVGGMVEGEALVTKLGLECWFGLDSETGTIVGRHPLRGRSIKGKILVFPSHMGSSGWGYRFCQNSLKGNGPLAIINRECDNMVTAAAIATDTPMLVEFDMDPCLVIETGDKVIVDADHGVVEVYKKKPLNKKAYRSLFSPQYEDLHIFINGDRASIDVSRSSRVKCDDDRSRCYNLIHKTRARCTRRKYLLNI